MRLIGRQRRMLTADTTFYVRTDGNDSTGDGSANTSAKAFATIAGAYSSLQRSIDAANYIVTIQVADGTYTAATTINRDILGAASVAIVGNTGTPSNVVISTTSANAISVGYCSHPILINGIKVQTTTSGYGVIVASSTVSLGANMVYGACVSADIFAYILSRVSAAGGTVNGNSPSLFQASEGAELSATGTFTFSGTPAFSTSTAWCRSAKIVSSATMSGSATGVRYTVYQCGVIDVFGAGASYFPGNSAGSTASGGQYV